MSALSDKAAWQYVPISSFLTCREGKYKPESKEVCDLQRLSKIDFSGQIHVSDKPSKTDMIIVMPHDLVISGINVAKGAIAVHQGDKPIAATIHYSSYTFDKTKIDIEYFKRFLQSPSFVETLQAQVKGGIKTEIKPKQFLPLMIHLPELAVQKEIAKHFQSFEQELSELSDESNQQDIYIKKLRQAILQEAIEGKLTADWRANNPVIKGDPNSDAQALLAQIQVEKQRLIAEGKIKKDKPLAPINDAEKPFELPEGWDWCRLGDLVNPQRPLTYGIVKMGEVPKEDGVFALRCSDVKFRYIANDQIRRVTHEISNEYQRTVLFGKEILLNIRGTLGGCAITDEMHVGFNIAREVALIVLVYDSMNEHVMNVLTSPFFNKSISDNLRGSVYKGLNLNLLNELLIPLAPLQEQTVIVEKVQHLLAQVDALETELKNRQVQTERLMQAVLAEAFSPSL